jgi:hypothetical protein
MSANGISHLEFKRQRQEAKLAAAAEKRAKDGKPSKLVKARMPTLYAPGENRTEKKKDNDNKKGLFAGRPWK